MQSISIPGVIYLTAWYLSHISFRNSAQFALGKQCTSVTKGPLQKPLRRTKQENGKPWRKNATLGSIIKYTGSSACNATRAAKLMVEAKRLMLVWSCVISISQLVLDISMCNQIKDTPSHTLSEDHRTSKSETYTQHVRFSKLCKLHLWWGGQAFTSTRFSQCMMWELQFLPGVFRRPHKARRITVQSVELISYLSMRWWDAMSISLYACQASDRPTQLGHKHESHTEHLLRA